MTQEVTRQGVIAPASGLMDGWDTGAGYRFRSLEQSFLAKITGGSAAAGYTWEEVLSKGDGTFQDLGNNGRHGTSANLAYELNANSVPSGTIVRLFHGKHAEMLFAWEGSTSGSSSSSSSSSSSGPNSSVTVVTDIQCSNGNLVVTKGCIILPPGASFEAGVCD